MIKYLIIPLLLAGIIGYYVDTAHGKNEGAVSPVLDALAYVKSHWQDGDVIISADDGPWVNLRPYTDLPLYRLPECNGKTGHPPVLGGLSEETRAALGVEIKDIDEIKFTRAWVFAISKSPLHPSCYFEQIAPITRGEPIIVVDDNDWLFSALWLMERSNE